MPDTINESKARVKSATNNPHLTFTSSFSGVSSQFLPTDQTFEDNLNLKSLRLEYSKLQSIDRE